MSKSSLKKQKQKASYPLPKTPRADGTQQQNMKKRQENMGQHYREPMLQANPNRDPRQNRRDEEDASGGLPSWAVRRTGNDNDFSGRDARGKTERDSRFSRRRGAKHDRKDGRLAKEEGTERSIPIEEEKGYSLSFQSEIRNPYTTDEVLQILEKNKPGELFDIDPSRMRTMHAGISERFSNDSEINDLVKRLKEDPSYMKHTPPIMVSAVELPERKWERGDEMDPKNTRELTLFTEDHRRVVAARLAGITKMKAQLKAEPSVTGNFTTQNRGMSVDVRKYTTTEEGRHQGSNVSTLPSSAKVYRYTDSDE